MLWRGVLAVIGGEDGIGLVFLVLEGMNRERGDVCLCSLIIERTCVRCN
jgi:hypothetical protein